MAARSMIRAVLVDLSGTIHIEDTVIPGSVEALNRLRQSDIPVRFVTNTTKESKKFLHKRLTSLGFDIKDSEIFTSLVAARQLVEKTNVRPLLMLEDEAMEDFEGINTNNPNAVVVGLSPSKFDYFHLNQAFRLILDGASLIAIHKSRYFKKKEGLCLGPGPFVSALEYATGKTASVVGKPEQAFFLEALSPLQVKPEETAMVGDDIRDDILGAQAIGMTGILVRTGKYRPGDETSANHTVDSFPEAVNLILNSKT